MSNIAAIARFYKVSNKCHACSILKALGLKILVSAVRFRLRAPQLPKNPLETRMIPAFPSILIMGCVDHGCRPE
jgi:hypothetical protein